MIAETHPDSNIEQVAYDYSYVTTTARIAIYDTMLSAPRILEISPADTTTFIGNLSSEIYDQAWKMGGKIPYTIIREISENFIHAQFEEVSVSILDNGNTIRFSDQGPGISEKEKAQKPGFTSANKYMKKYIRGVGSGLPIVKEFLEISHGSLEIEDNMNSGTVLTLKMETEQSQATEKEDNSRAVVKTPRVKLNEREISALSYLLGEDSLGVTDLARLMEMPQSTTYNLLQKLEEYGYVEKTERRGRCITESGKNIVLELGN